LYFTEGVVRAWGDAAPGNYCAMVEVLLCMVLFSACAFHVRLRLKHARVNSLAEQVDASIQK
jgi:uncharacterized membrane protein